MFDKPNRLALLEAVHQTFSQDILPTLEGDPKYAGLMVASAIKMTMREIESDSNHHRLYRVLKRFANLYGEDNVQNAGIDDKQRIKVLNKQLVIDIRDGQFDEDPKGLLFKVLIEQAYQRLSISNPKFVEASEYSQPDSV